LLDRVEQGEEIVITRHGRPVARLVPNQGGINRQQAEAAAKRIRERCGSASRWALQLEEAEGGSGCWTSMSLVIHTSVALAWIYSEETTPAVTHVLQLVNTGGAWAASGRASSFDTPRRSLSRTGTSPPLATRRS